MPCYSDNYHLNFYAIMFNMTLFKRTAIFSNWKNVHPKDTVVLKLKHDIDKALIKFYTGSDMSMQFREYPRMSLRYFTGINVVAQSGSMFFMVPYLILMLMQISAHLK